LSAILRWCRWLEVTANYGYGMAKIWDFDILRFALSKAGEITLQVGYFPSSVEFLGYECLKALGRNPESGSNCSDLQSKIGKPAIKSVFQPTLSATDGPQNRH